MSNHRYTYMYLPLTRFIRQLSPRKQTLLAIAQVTLIVILVGFQFV
jgi:type II secretory pathway component PulM